VQTWGIYHSFKNPVGLTEIITGGKLRFFALCQQLDGVDISRWPFYQSA